MAQAERRLAKAADELEASGLELEHEWQAVCDVLRTVASKMQPARPIALAISTAARHGVCLDASGAAFSVPLSWRPDPVLMAELGSHPGWGHGGMSARGSAPWLAARLVMLRRRYPEWALRVARTGPMHAYLLWKLAGRWATDVAAGPGSDSWPAAVSDLAGITPDALPAVLARAEIAGPLAISSASECGLPAGLPVVCGGQDGACANVGAQALDPGDCCFTLSTNFVARIVCDAPVGGHFGYPLEGGAWAWAEDVQRSGWAIDAVAEVLLPTELAVTRHQLLSDLAGASQSERAASLRLQLPIGAEELRSRVEEWLASGWSPTDIYRGVVESALDALLALLRQAEEAGCSYARAVATGGFSEVPFLLSRLASRIGRPVHLAAYEAAARGAASYAAVALGWFADVRAASVALSPRRWVILPEEPKTVSTRGGELT